MSNATASERVARFESAVRRRLILVNALEGAALGFLVGAAVAIVSALFGADSGFVLAASAASVAGAFLIHAVRGHRRYMGTHAIALAVESRTGAFRNTLLTASELQARRIQAPGWITESVVQLAAATSDTLHPERLFPFKRLLGVQLAISATLLGTVLILLVKPSLTTAGAGHPDDAATLSSVEISVQPPDYTNLAPFKLIDPESIEVLEGSAVTVAARGSAAVMHLETLAGQVRMSAADDGSFRSTFTAEGDGFISVSPINRNEQQGNSRFLAIRVVPDQRPRVVISAPGRDLFVPDANRTIPIELEVSDDIALTSLRLLYTRVAGSGEQFSFTEGEVPLTVERTSATSWKARASWQLSSLNLEPGDMIVYRGAGQDGRPGAPTGESDTYIIELTGPGALLTGGFSIDDEHDRYAVSQQMVILRSERLLARKDSIPVEAFNSQSAEIAAEQRRVRAEFVFMMGGHLGDHDDDEVAGMGDLDEHSHAAVDDEAVAGRLAHQGRLDLIRALRSMSHANTLLVGAQVADALEAERTALAHLQRAFSRTRYILRTLTERERLDLSRRLTGTLATAARSVSPVAEAPHDSTQTVLRSAMADLAALIAGQQEGADAAERANGIARRLIVQNSADSSLRDVAATLGRAATELSAGNRAAAGSSMAAAAASLANRIRNNAAPMQVRDERRLFWKLNSALTDALRAADPPR